MNINMFIISVFYESGLITFILLNLGYAFSLSYFSLNLKILFSPFQIFFNFYVTYGVAGWGTNWSNITNCDALHAQQWWVACDAAPHTRRHLHLFSELAYLSPTLWEENCVLKDNLETFLLFFLPIIDHIKLGWPAGHHLCCVLKIMVKCKKHYLINQFGNNGAYVWSILESLTILMD